MQTVSHERRELRYDKKSGNVTHESLVTTATLGYDDEDEAEDADPSSCASNASIVQERRKVTYKVPQSRKESSRNKVRTYSKTRKRRKFPDALFIKELNSQTESTIKL